MAPYVPEIWTGTAVLLPVVPGTGAARMLAWPVYATPAGQAATLLASRWPQKPVGAVLDYGIDLSDFLAVDGDTVTSATVTASNSGLTVGTISHTTTSAKVFLSAGTALTDYLLSWSIVTTAGRTLTPTVRMLVVANSDADLYITDGAGNLLIGPAGAILESE